MKRPQRKKRRAPLLLTSLVVIGGGAVGGWYWLQSQAQESSGGEPTGRSAMTALDTAGRDTAQAVINGSVAGDSTVSLADNTPAGGGVEEQPQEPVPDPVTAPVTGGRETQSRPQTQRPAPQQPVVPQIGWLTVNSNPFGSIWIDNVFIQETPLFRHELTPGTYVLEIRREGFQTEVDTVRITARNELKRQKILVRIP